MTIKRFGSDLKLMNGYQLFDLGGCSLATLQTPITYLPRKPILPTLFSYVELFAGIGGFRQSLDVFGGDCVFASEINEVAQKAYTALYGDEHLRGDITEISAEEVPCHDVLVGGFPCQTFSISGRRLGVQDTRGTLFYDAVRIAAHHQPKFLLFENVKGLLSNANGDTVAAMLHALNEIGYYVDLHMLDSSFFHVAQSRERLFILGVRKDLLAQSPWNIQGKSILARTKKRLLAEGLETFAFNWPQQDEVTVRIRHILEPQVAEKYYLTDVRVGELVKEYNHLMQLEEPTKQQQQSLLTLNQQIRDCIQEIVNKTRKNQTIGVTIKPNGDMRPFRADFRKSGLSELTIQCADNLAATVTAAHMPKVYGEQTDYRVRKLIPKEGLKIQGFPDHIHDHLVAAGISDSQICKLAGNAVCVPVVDAIVMNFWHFAVQHILQTD